MPRPLGAARPGLSRARLSLPRLLSGPPLLALLSRPRCPRARTRPSGRSGRSGRPGRPGSARRLRAGARTGLSRPWPRPADAGHRVLWPLPLTIRPLGVVRGRAVRAWRNARPRRSRPWRRRAIRAGARRAWRQVSGARPIPVSGVAAIPRIDRVRLGVEVGVARVPVAVRPAALTIHPVPPDANLLRPSSVGRPDLAYRADVQLPPVWGDVIWRRTGPARVLDARTSGYCRT